MILQPRRKPRLSAGVLLYRRAPEGLLVFLAHPGGPFWARKDAGAWSIPKGEPNPHEELFTAARREFHEEIGFAPEGEFLALTPLKQKSGKTIHIWAVAGEIDAAHIVSNEFEMEWPPRSGRLQRFPEIDRAAWFALTEARERLQPGQVPFLDELAEKLA